MKCLFNTAGGGRGHLQRDAVVVAMETITEVEVVVDEDEAVNDPDAFSCTLLRNTTETVQKLL